MDGDECMIKYNFSIGRTIIRVSGKVFSLLDEFISDIRDKGLERYIEKNKLDEIEIIYPEIESRLYLYMICKHTKPSKKSLVRLLNDLVKLNNLLYSVYVSMYAYDMYSKETKIIERIMSAIDYISDMIQTLISTK